MKVLTKSPVSGSNEAVGSSNNKMSGSLTTAFARLTLFFWPEESSPVFLFINSPNLNVSVR